MARDFDFKGVGQADFTNANQMVAQARMAWDNALKMAQDTLADTNKAVSNRNEALLQDYMNSIPQDQWGTAEANVAVDNAFEKVKELTGGMYDAKVMNTYRDNRGTELLQRQANDLTVKKQAQDWIKENENYQIIQLAETLPQLEAIVNNPELKDTPAFAEATAQLEAINEQFGANPHWASRVNDRITAISTDREKAKEALIQAQLTSHLPDIKTLADKFIDVEERRSMLTLPEDADDATKANYETELTALQADSASLQALLKPYTDNFGAGRIHQIIDELRAKRAKGRLKSAETQSKIGLNNARGTASLVNAKTGETRAENDFTLGTQGNEIKAYEAYVDAGDKIAKQESAEAKVNAEFTLTRGRTYGLPDDYIKAMMGTDGKIKPSRALEVINTYVNNASKVVNKLPNTKFSYNEWLKQPSTVNAVTNFKKEASGHDTIIMNYVKDYIANNRHLSDFEKIALFNEGLNGARSRITPYDSGKIGGFIANSFVGEDTLNKGIAEFLNQTKTQQYNKNLKNAQDIVEGMINLASASEGISNVDFLALHQNAFNQNHILPYLPAHFKRKK